MSRTLIVTNDYPPRAGGIQAFVQQLAERQPADSVVVYAPAWKGAQDFDQASPIPVERHGSSLMLPVPEVARRAVQLMWSHRCDTVWFGAAAPLGLLAPALRRAGASRVVAQTHGHEAGWAGLPGGKQLLARIAKHIDVITYLGGYTRSKLEPAMASRTDLQWLAPGVDTGVFRPQHQPSVVRQRLGLADRPVIVCVSRLVPRKGQDQLIRALPLVQQRIPGAALLLVSGGPDAPRLHRLAHSVGVASDVVFTGSVPWAELPDYYNAGDVFAMPCRTRNRGLDVEGLGIVYLEASACGLPVIAGDSGGAPDAVRDGVTGSVVGGRDLSALVERLCEVLGDPGMAARLGSAGRRWVEQVWRPDQMAERMRQLLQPTD